MWPIKHAPHWREKTSQECQIALTSHFVFAEWCWSKDQKVWTINCWCVDCSAILARVVVALVCRVRRGRSRGLRMFRPLSIDSGSTRAHDKAPRLWVPAAYQAPTCLSNALVPLDIVLQINCHTQLNYRVENSLLLVFVWSLIPRMDVAASWPKGWRLQAFRGCSVELGVPACDQLAPAETSSPQTFYKLSAWYPVWVSPGKVKAWPKQMLVPSWYLKGGWGR